jgi:hypothetical protein
VKILIACEFSGIVRESFAKKGHDAWSCDLLPTEIPGQHIQGDVLDVINNGWDMMIAHPPCTHLTCTANKYFLNNPERWLKRYEAMIFVHKLFNCNIPKICIENPVGVISSHIRKPDQYIQPYMFGDKAQKKTGLWLKNLPLLIPTNIVEPEIIKKDGYIDHRWHYGTDAKTRSRTFKGIAEAMAEQWSKGE